MGCSPCGHKELDPTEQLRRIDSVKDYHMLNGLRKQKTKNKTCYLTVLEVRGSKSASLG